MQIELGKTYVDTLGDKWFCVTRIHHHTEPGNPVFVINNSRTFDSLNIRSNGENFRTKLGSKLVGEYLRPDQGGCWFCWIKNDKLSFYCEFDTYVHVDCIKRTLAKDPTHPEAKLMEYLCK